MFIMGSINGTAYFPDVMLEPGHAVAYLVEALCYKPESHGSIPDEFTDFF
jgi:hypothetical protein